VNNPNRAETGSRCLIRLDILETPAAPRSTDAVHARIWCHMASKIAQGLFRDIVGFASWVVASLAPHSTSKDPTLSRMFRSSTVACFAMTNHE